MTDILSVSTVDCRSTRIDGFLDWAMTETTIAFLSAFLRFGAGEIVCYIYLDIRYLV